ncbi:hypothetical protein QJQ45_019335 [Haematococcus lacustris]|nr:hypothetical protein QJQ45_019335 [Haematococcus lacustris]
MGGGVRDLLRRFRQLKDTFSRAHAADATPPAPPVFSGVPGPDFDLPEGSDILLAAPLDLTLLAAHSGPDEGIRNIAACAPDLQLRWDQPTEWACGHSISAYDAAPATGTRNGNPIADCFGITAYKSGSVLALADGVNWGEPARRAARCAVLGACAHLHQALAGLGSDAEAPPPSCRTLFLEMRAAVAAAQKLILQQCGTLTTLVITVVCRCQPGGGPARKRPVKAHSSGGLTGKAANPLAGLALSSASGGSGGSRGAGSSSLLMDLLHGRHKSGEGHGGGGGGSSQGQGEGEGQGWVALTVNVGDSAAWVWRAAQATVDELTAGSHQGLMRNVRWTPGALGFALGDDPDLSNLTASLTKVLPGDIVFLGSDGVADNFDPILLQTARAAEYASEVASASDPLALPALDPAAVQEQALANLTQALLSLLTPLPSQAPSPSSRPSSPYNVKTPFYSLATTANASSPTYHPSLLGTTRPPPPPEAAASQGGHSNGASALLWAGNGAAKPPAKQATCPDMPCANGHAAMHAGLAAKPAASAPLPSNELQQLLDDIRVCPRRGGGSFKGNMVPGAAPPAPLPCNQPGSWEMDDVSEERRSHGRGVPPAPAFASLVRMQSLKLSSSGAAARQPHSASNGYLTMTCSRSQLPPQATSQLGDGGSGGWRAAGAAAQAGMGLEAGSGPAGGTGAGAGGEGVGCMSPSSSLLAGPEGQGQGQAAPHCLTAQVLVEGLLRYVYQVTEPHRQAVERRAAVAAGLLPAAAASDGGAAAAAAPPVPRAMRSLATDSPMRTTSYPKLPPGKLDHATLVAYQVGGQCTPAKAPSS